MQIDRIIDKAKRLGFDVDNSVNQMDNLRHLATQLGVEDLVELEQTLDNMLMEENVELLDTQMGNEENSLVPIQDENKYLASTNNKQSNNSQNRIPRQNNKFAKTQNKPDSDSSNLKKFGSAVNRALNKISDLKVKTNNSEGLDENSQNEETEERQDKKNSLMRKVGTKVKNEAMKVVVNTTKSIIIFLKANPIALVIILFMAIFIFVLLIFLLFDMFDTATRNGGPSYGMHGYDYYSGACTEVSIEGNRMTIEEYVEGVVAGEVAHLGDYPETLKVFAIAARTYLVQSAPKNGEGENCYYAADDVKQAYNTERITAEIRSAVNDTRGLVITVDGNASSFYDSSCVYTPEQARLADPTGNYSDMYYYIKYGGDTIGGINFQPIEYSRIETNSAFRYLRNYISEAEQNGECSGNHGRGMSQSGSAYLELFDGYSWQQIIDYYYQNRAVVKSLYASYEVSNNWTQVIDDSTSSSIASTILDMPLNKLLSQAEYNKLNTLIYDSVISAGIGTRDAIVAAAVIPIQYLAENYNVVIPYTMGGGHSRQINGLPHNSIDTYDYFGVDPLWGTRISHTTEERTYRNFGPDCSAWATLVLQNAGLEMNKNRSSAGFKELGDSLNSVEKSSTASKPGTPGDLLWREGHIMVIVGVDENEQVYYVSHARGGDYGTVITKERFSNEKNHIIRMDNYLPNNINENYVSGYTSKLLRYEDGAKQ